jgi:hypothetical protein
VVFRCAAAARAAAAAAAAPLPFTHRTLLLTLPDRLPPTASCPNHQRQALDQVRAHLQGLCRQEGAGRQHGQVPLRRRARARAPDARGAGHGERRRGCRAAAPPAVCRLLRAATARCALAAASCRQRCAAAHPAARSLFPSPLRRSQCVDAVIEQVGGGR